MGRFAAHHLLPGEGDDVELGPVDVHGEHRRGGVADGEAFTRSAAMKSALGTRTPEVVPFQVNTTSRRSLRTLVQVRQLAVGRVEHFDVLQLEHGLVTSVTQSLPNDLEGDDLDTGLGPSIDHHRRFHGAGARRGGHDADQIVGGDVQDLAGLVDGGLETRLARSLERWERPTSAPCRFSSFQPGRLAQGPDENLRERAGRMAGLAGVVWVGLSPILADEQRPVGGGVARERFIHSTAGRWRPEISPQGGETGPAPLPSSMQHSSR